MKLIILILTVCVTLVKADYYCNSNFDCKTSYYCETSQPHNTWAGTCVYANPAGTSCIDDYHCQGYCKNSVCQTPIADGKPCTGAYADGHECVSYDYCSASKICTSRYSNGAQCTSSTQCASFYCEQNSASRYYHTCQDNPAWNQWADAIAGLAVFIIVLIVVAAVIGLTTISCCIYCICIRPRYTNTVYMAQPSIVATGYAPVYSAYPQQSYSPGPAPAGTYQGNYQQSYQAPQNGQYQPPSTIRG